MKIHIEIGKLALQGFDYHDHKRISMAIERELARLINENGLATLNSQEHKIANIDAGSFNVPANMNPKTIGEVSKGNWSGL